MRPSGRLVISAVLCVFAVVPALAEVWSLMSADSPAQAEMVIPARAIGILVGVFCLAFAGWGIANAVGLLRRLPWVRTSILLFAALVIVTNGVGIAGYFLTARDAAHKSVLIPRLVLMVTGVWWLVVFNGEEGRRELSAAGPSR